MHLDDAPHHRKAETRAGFLGREERVEDLGEGGFVHTGPIVTHRDADRRPVFARGVVELDRDPSSGSRRLARVHHDVDQRVLKQVRVDSHQSGASVT